MFHDYGIAVDASSKIDIRASQLSFQHVGKAYLDTFAPIFITGLRISGQNVIVEGFSVTNGIPTMHSNTMSGSDCLTLLPDLRLATFTPDRLGSVKSPVESLDLSLPTEYYGASNARKDVRNGWRVESFEGSQARLVRK